MINDKMLRTSIVATSILLFASADAFASTLYAYGAQRNDEGSTDFQLSISDGFATIDLTWNNIRQDFGTLIVEDAEVLEPAVTFLSLSGGFSQEVALPFDLLGDPGVLYVNATWSTSLDPVSTMIPASISVGMGTAQENLLSGRIEWRGESLPFDVQGDFCGSGCEVSATWELDGPPIPFQQARLANSAFYNGGSPRAVTSGLGLEWTVGADHTTQPQGSAGYNLVPEPSAGLLLAAGLLGLGTRRCIRRARPRF